MKLFAKRTLALMCAVTMLLLAVLPTSAVEPATITVESATVHGGEETEDVAVTIRLENNPGIAGCSLRMTYDSNLMVKSITRGSALSMLTFTQPGNLSSNPMSLVMDGLDADSSNGTLFTITFTTPISEAKTYAISLAYNPGDIYDQDMDDLDVQLVSGGITVSAPAHTHAYTDVVTPPTCTERGYTTHTCTCGDSYADSYVAALGHVYDDNQDTICNVCGFERTVTPINPSSPIIIVGSASVPSGVGTEDVAVTIQLENNPGIAGCSLRMVYDGELTVKSITRGSALSTLTFTKPGNLSANPMSMVMDGLDADTSNGTLFTITFTVPISKAKTYGISLSYNLGDIYDQNMDDLDVQLVSGGITVSAEPTYRLGDVNGDGAINTVDASMALQFYVDSVSHPLDATQQLAADVDGNGVVNTVDASMILQHYVGNCKATCPMH